MDVECRRVQEQNNNNKTANMSETDIHSDIVDINLLQGGRCLWNGLYQPPISTSNALTANLQRHLHLVCPTIVQTYNITNEQATIQTMTELPDDTKL